MSSSSGKLQTLIAWSPPALNILFPSGLSRRSKPKLRWAPSWDAISSGGSEAKSHTLNSTNEPGCIGAEMAARNRPSETMAPAPLVMGVSQS